MPTIDVNGETIAYQRAGSGTPLVLVHSLGTASWLWREQMERWQDRFDVIAFDARGHGASSHRGGFTLADVAADIVAALQALGVGPACFLGISMGGQICARIHQSAPDRVLRLVIADSFATLGDKGPERVSALEATIGGMTIAGYGEQYADETILPGTDRRHRDALAASIGGMEKDSYLQAVRSVFTGDVVEALRGVTVPTLVVGGEAEQRTPVAANRTVADLVPGARFEIIPNAAHLANLDNPRGFHDIVHPFLVEQKSGG